jgi:hypothetical protein
MARGKQIEIGSESANVLVAIIPQDACRNDAERTETARLIVQACNSRQALVDAARDALAQLVARDAVHYHGDTETTRALRAALTLAGETP